MKLTNLLFALLTLLPFTMAGQADTYHQNFEGSFQNPPWYDGSGWNVNVRWKFVVNQVRKTNNGVVEIRYTNNYSSFWEYVNQTTGERKVGPENENVTGVFTSGPGGWSNDRHWVYHYVNDPVFGAYHIVFKLLWEYDPVTGFMVVRDVQNEWYRQP